MLFAGFGLHLFVCDPQIMPHYIKRRKWNGEHTKAQEFIDGYSHLHGMVLDVYFNIYFTLGYFVIYNWRPVWSVCLLSHYLLAKYIDIVVFNTTNKQAYFIYNINYLYTWFDITISFSFSNMQSMVLYSEEKRVNCFIFCDSGKCDASLITNIGIFLVKKWNILFIPWTDSKQIFIEFFWFRFRAFRF